MQLINVRLLTSDFAAAYRFWREVMQLTVAFGPDTPGAPADYAYFQVGEVGVELMSRTGFADAIGEATAPASADRQAVLVFKVDDVDASYADLVARGAPSVTAPHDRPAWGARTAHVADPDGHLVEIYTPLPPANA